MEDKEKVEYIQIFFSRITDCELDLMTPFSGLLYKNYRKSTVH